MPRDFSRDPRIYAPGAIKGVPLTPLQRKLLLESINAQHKAADAFWQGYVVGTLMTAGAVSVVIGILVAVGRL